VEGQCIAALLDQIELRLAGRQVDGAAHGGCCPQGGDDQDSQDQSRAHGSGPFGGGKTEAKLRNRSDGCQHGQTDFRHAKAQFES